MLGATQGEARKPRTFVLSDEETWVSLVYFNKCLNQLILVLFTPEAAPFL